MEESNNTDKIMEAKTFSVPLALGEIKGNLIFTTNSSFQTSQEEIIKKAFKFHSQGNLSEAAKYYQLFINQGFKDHSVFSNYGIILKNIRKFKEAEFFLKKAIPQKMWWYYLQ